METQTVDEAYTKAYSSIEKAIEELVVAQCELQDSNLLGDKDQEVTISIPNEAGKRTITREAFASEMAAKIDKTKDDLQAMTLWLEEPGLK